MTGHQEETAITNAAIGQFYGPNIHNGVHNDYFVS
jgi:hypothetical protein